MPSLNLNSRSNEATWRNKDTFFALLGHSFDFGSLLLYDSTWLTVRSCPDQEE